MSAAEAPPLIPEHIHDLQKVLLLDRQTFFRAIHDLIVLQKPEFVLWLHEQYEDSNILAQTIPDLEARTIQVALVSTAFSFYAQLCHPHVTQSLEQSELALANPGLFLTITAFARESSKHCVDNRLSLAVTMHDTLLLTYLLTQEPATVQMLLKAMETTRTERGMDIMMQLRGEMS